MRLISLKNPHTLPREPYGGTGKRLFIGLVTGSAVLVCLLLLLIWLVPTFGFAAIHPYLPWMTGIFFGGSILGVIWLSLSLVLQAYSGHSLPGTSRLRGVTVRLLLPLMELVGRLAGIPVDAVRRSFIKVNNELVLAGELRCPPEKILVLLPHCIQASQCAHRLNYRIDNCARCGSCSLRDLLALRDSLGIQLALATGGTVARRIVVQARPSIILAVACERDLASGIRDTYPIPVFGVLNERPNGPCLDTSVSLTMVEDAVRRFIA